jgi:hypothetical protein
MKNKYSDTNKVFEIVKNFSQLLFTKQKVSKDRKVRIERINRELLINSKQTLYKQLQNGKS